MTRTIFYSWQSDLNRKHNRYFLRDVIKNAIKKTNKLDDFSIYHDFDRDTKGTSGTPDIAYTIFDKIKNSEIFICDISIINNYHSKERKTPNPNVLLELGYAASEIGWGNVICLFNESYGQLSDLPFDIQMRRVMTYSLDDNCDKTKVKSDLTLGLIEAIKAISNEEVQHKRKVKRSFQNETQLALKLALNKPPYWAFMLTEELLRSRFENIKTRISQIDNGTIYFRRIKLGNYELFQKCNELNTNGWHLILSLQSIMNNGWLNAMAEYGQESDEILILNSILLLDEWFHLVLEWEIEIKRLISPDEIKSDMLKVSLGIRPNILAFENFLSKLNEMHTKKIDSFDFALDLELHEDYVLSMKNVIEYFNHLISQGELIPR